MRAQTFMKNNLFTGVIFTVLLLITGLHTFAQVEPINYAAISKQTFTYAVKDSAALGLDIYRLKNNDTAEKKPCVIFVFGGAFIAGHRNDSIYNNYFNALAEHGYITVAISYRLGMRGVKKVSKFNTAPLKHAIDMAVDDLYDATNWVISNATAIGIDTSKIILSGSSSGAVTVLQSDFEKRNEKNASKKLLEHFQYAGIVSFSGAILSFDGKLKYHLPPAPTLFFHGTADKTVPYNKIRFFNKGLWGSSAIAETFKKENYPYYIYRAEGLGHEISVLPMINQLPVILNFLDQFVLQQKPLQVDMSYKDPAIKPIMIMTPAQLFKKLQQHNIVAAISNAK